ncbi:MAG: helix-turn-helix domain-containing protein [Bacteroides sp.]|nr:helix-turn-helix domain-containing protein [Bacteroides sp.]
MGPIKQAFDYTLNVGSEILVANFKDDAFFRFFGNYRLEEMFIDPDQLFVDGSFASLHHSISALPAVEEKITAILAFARPYLMPRAEAFERIAKFSTGNEALSPVKTISETYRVSERTVQLSHKKYLGYSSKEAARYNRFLKTIKLLQKNEVPIDWLEIVTIRGYYDQSQLIKDFRHFLNLTPTQYLKFKDSLCSSTLD